jgi:hypothetical protein
MNRRSLLKLAALPGAAIAAPGAARRKAPFKVLYSNDTTNILTCLSPYHPKRAGELTNQMVEATVDEAAGVEAHLLQPGLSWIPWWKSRLYPIADHFRWIKQTTGRDPDTFGRYLLGDNDLVKTFIDRCRLRRQAPFISFRMNDGHMLENAGSRNPGAAWVSRFYAEHPEYRIGADPKSWDQRVHNWAIPEVREHKFGFIREICQGYDIDGLELDFMRHTSYFRLRETTVAQRVGVMRDFVARVRRLLDETSRPGRRRWLCARVPCFLKTHDPLGVDVPAMVDAGLDMVNLSGFYFTIQQTDLATVRKMAPHAAVYLEMTHSLWNGPSLPGGYDSFPFLRTTDHHYYTTANLAYSRGADGVSLFNFVYYREHGSEGRGPFNEPPFHVLKRLGDPAWLRKQQPWYMLSKGWNNPMLGDQALPVTFQKGERHIFVLDIAPGAHNQQGLFRLRTLADSSACAWTVRWNGVQLKPAAYVAKPIHHPYDAFLGRQENYACFTIPPGVVGDGGNQLSVVMDRGEPMRVEYLDLVLSA